MRRHDIRIYDLSTGRIIAEVRRVDSDHAVRAVRALICPYMPPEWDGVAGTGWASQPAVKVKVKGGQWRWVGPETAKKMGVFPKREAVT